MYESFQGSPHLNLDSEKTGRLKISQGSARRVPMVRTLEKRPGMENDRHTGRSLGRSSSNVWNIS